MTGFTEKCKLNIQTKYLLEDVLGGYCIMTNDDGLVDVGYHYGEVILVSNDSKNDEYSIELHVNAITKRVCATIIHNGNWETKTVFEFAELLMHEKDLSEISNMLYKEIIRDGKIPTAIARITIGLYHWMLTGETKDPENNYLPLAIHVDDEDTNVLRIANRLHVNTNGARMTSLMEEDSEKDFFSFSIDKEFKVFKVSNAYGDVVDSRLFDDISELEGIITNNQALYKFIMGAYLDFCEMTPEVFDARYSVKPLENDEDEEMDLSPEKSPYPNLDEIVGNWTMELDDLGYNEKQASYKLVNGLTDEYMLVTFNHNVNHIAVEVNKPDGEDPYSHQIDTNHSDYDKGSESESGSAIINSVNIRYRNLFAAVYFAEQYRKQTNMTIPLIVKPEHNGVILANSVAAFYNVACLDKDTDNALPLFFCNFELEFFGPCDADGALRHMTSIEDDLLEIQGAYIKDSIGFIRYLRWIGDIYYESGSDGIAKKYNHMADKSFTGICKQIISQYGRRMSGDEGKKSTLQTILSNIIGGINNKTEIVSADNPGSVVKLVGITDAKSLVSQSNQITSNLNNTIELKAKKPEENKSFFDMASHYKFEKTADGDVTISITLPRIQAEQLEEFIKH
nr:MAG TPA: hypothetical protein [Caudoviricetes sp.]